MKTQNKNLTSFANQWICSGNRRKVIAEKHAFVGGDIIFSICKFNRRRDILSIQP